MDLALPRFPALPSGLGALAAGAGAAALGAGLLRLFPKLELELFARGAALGAGLFLGVAPERIAEGWLLALPGEPVAVTAACSATDFFLMAATLFAWRLASHRRHPAIALAAGLAAALPATLAVNALRIVAVTAAHRWFIPLFPASYSALLHMAVGAAVFLPALIALHLAPEFHGRFRHLLARPTHH